MPRRKRDDQADSASDEDRDDQSYDDEEESEEVQATRQKRNKRNAKKKDAGAIAQMRMPSLQNTQMKRKIFKKLGYQAVQEDQKVPEEIFQFLWKVSQNEQNTFLKSAKQYSQLKILDRPKRRLDAMIDLRMELLQMCDGFYEQVKSVTDRVLSEVHDPETDEGLIEEDIDRYMSCFSVDLSGFDQLLIKEIKNRKADLESAQQEAETLQEKMQEVLVTNEQGLKNFLEESKFKVDLLAAAERERAAMAKQEFKDKLIDMHGMSLIETNLKMKKDAAAQEAGIVPAEQDAGKKKDKNIIGLADDSDEDDMMHRNLQPIKGAGDWLPQLRKTDQVGEVSKAAGRTFQWPTYQDLEGMDLRKRIKLSGFGIKANTNLYQLKFVYTGSYESRTFNSMDGTTDDPKLHQVWPEKPIGSVEVLVRSESGQSNIYGIRFMDHRDRQIQERQWRRSGSARWVKILVPPEMEVIGFHGSHDGSYIKSFGLILWTPNPATLAY